MRTIHSLLRGVGWMTCALLVAACDSDGGGRSVTEPGGVELRVGNVSGNNQQAEVATALPGRLSIQVQDRAQKPAAGRTVRVPKLIPQPGNSSETPSAADSRSWEKSSTTGKTGPRF